VLRKIFQNKVWDKLHVGGDYLNVNLNFNAVFYYASVIAGLNAQPDVYMTLSFENNMVTGGKYTLEFSRLLV